MISADIWDNGLYSIVQRPSWISSWQNSYLSRFRWSVSWFQWTPLSHNSLPEIIVVMTVSVKYIFLITTSLIHPSIQYLITIFTVPIISSSPEVVEINISSFSNFSRVIMQSKSLQIWHAVLLSQTILSFSGYKPLEILLVYSEVTTRPFWSFDFC